jgi:hypothetical protein
MYVFENLACQPKLAEQVAKRCAGERRLVDLTGIEPVTS